MHLIVLPRGEAVLQDLNEQLPERMLKKFQDNRKYHQPDINFQYIPLPPIFPPSGIQKNYARKRRDQKEKREAGEHLRRARKGLGQLMPWLRTDR